MKKVMTYFPVYFRYVENEYDSNINFSEDHNFGVIERLIDYILDEKKSKIYFFGTSGVVNTYCPRTLALQFYAVQAAFNRTDDKKIAHMIISFRRETGIDDFDAADIAQRIADYIGQKFQTVFAVHTNTDNIHVHFVINRVSYIDGLLYRTTTTSIKNYYDIINQFYGEAYDGKSIGGYGYCRGYVRIVGNL